MNMRMILGSGAAMALAAMLSASGAQGAMTPTNGYSHPVVQKVDCAVGFHIGPVGGCILGVEEERHDTVIEKRATDEGCETKSVKRTDDMGNTETRSRTDCD